MMKQILLDVNQIAIRAGQEILQYYGLSHFDFKDDQTPITKADIASHDCIVNGLSAISSYLISSEEDQLAYKVRKDLEYYWLIDPLDGTKAFLDGQGDFTVNIALIAKNQPVLGVVYAVLSDELYFASKGYGAYRIMQASSELQKGYKETLDGSRKIDNDKLVGCDSLHHSCKKTQAFFECYQLDKKTFASSLKICRVALGECDLYPRFNTTKEWDIAAAHIILRESGGDIIDCVTQKALCYNKPDISNAHFVAFSQTQMHGKIYIDITESLKWR